jgi:hypothetical protein
LGGDFPIVLPLPKGCLIYGDICFILWELPTYFKLSNLAQQKSMLVSMLTKRLLLMLIVGFTGQRIYKVIVCVMLFFYIGNILLQ